MIDERKAKLRKTILLCATLFIFAVAIAGCGSSASQNIGTGDNSDAAPPMFYGPDIPGLLWQTHPKFAYAQILRCPIHGFFAYRGEWIDEKTGEETGESCEHGEEWTAFVYDSEKDLFGVQHISAIDSSFEFYSKEEFELEYSDYMNSINPFSDYKNGELSGKIALANGCDFVSGFIYDDVERWRPPNDIIAVAENGKWGLLDNAGNIVVPFVFDHAISIDSTTAFAQYDGLYGIISLETN